MKLKHLTVIGLALTSLIFTSKATAAIRCETQYGGNEVCVKTGEIQIDKQVLNPNTSSFVDNLSLYTHYFKANDEITFKLIVKNIGDHKLSSVHVVDTLPGYLTLISGDLDYYITDLEVGETDEKEFKVKVLDNHQLPNQSLTCVINTGEVWADDQHDSDTSQICIEKELETLPATGPGLNSLILLSSTFSAGAGLFFLKQAKSQ